MHRSSVLWLVVLTLAGCGGAARGETTRPGAPRPATQAAAHWNGLQTVKGVVDLSAPRRDGSILVAAAGRLWLRAPGGRLTPFAPGYRVPAGLEPYIALSSAQQAGGCRFPAGAIYALRLTNGDGLTLITRSGRVTRFARLPAHGLENGIAFDQTGRFGHRLLVTATAHGTTAVFAVGCRGRVQTLTSSAPHVEGGIAVAPRAFGRFGGQLIAPDELSGRIYAVAPDGHVTLVVQTAIPHGPDTGVESEGFVPGSYSRALVADRLTPGNHHPGDDLILSLSHTTLTARGVNPGDLLVVSEGGAETVVVQCAHLCNSRLVALDPAQAHVEGHVSFSR